VEPGTNGAFLFQQNTMRDAMIAGVTLNIFNNHCDRVRMANLAQTVNVLQAVVLTDGEKMIVTPTYHVMEMYAVHHDAVMLPVEVPLSPYMFGKDTLSAISVSASRDREGVTHVSLVNIDHRQSRDVLLDAKGMSWKSVSGRILASKAVQDHNTFAELRECTRWYSKSSLARAISCGSRCLPVPLWFLPSNKHAPAGETNAVSTGS